MNLIYVLCYRYVWRTESECCEYVLKIVIVTFEHFWTQRFCSGRLMIFHFSLKIDHQLPKIQENRFKCVFSLMDFPLGFLTFLIWALFFMGHIHISHCLIAKFVKNVRWVCLLNGLCIAVKPKSSVHIENGYRLMQSYVLLILNTTALSHNIRSLHCYHRFY